MRKIWDSEELIDDGFKGLMLWEHDIRAMNINEFKTKLYNIQ